MPPETAKLERLKQLLNIANDGLSEAKFLEYFKQVIKQISRLEEQLLKKIDDTLNKKSQAFNEQIINLLSESKMSFQKMYESHEKAMESMKTEMSKVVKNMVSDHEKKMQKMDEKMMEMHDGKNADESMIIEKVLERIPKPKDGEPGKNIDPEILENLQNELKSLKEETERIKNLPRGKFGMRKVQITKVEDLTSQVDGVATTFTLPRDTVRVHMVWSTQFPLIFSSSDFSLSGNILSLGSGVGTIQSGQTLMAMIEVLFYQ